MNRIPRDIFALIIIILASIFSFGLGYLAGLDAGQENDVGLESSPDVDTSSDGQVVASKSGTKYYLPWCSGAERISDANKMWFASALDAHTAGYTPAENCNGI